MLRCGVCNVDVCNACLASGSVRAQPSAGAPGQRVGGPQPAQLAPHPPPAYHEFRSQPHKARRDEDGDEGYLPPPPPRPCNESFAPPAGAVPRRARPPPSYHDLEDSSCSPERDTPAVSRGGKIERSPSFRCDSIVRVCGIDDEELDNKLMTVIGFEPDRHGGDGPGLVVLQRRGKVLRVSASVVFNVVE